MGVTKLSILSGCAALALAVAASAAPVSLVTTESIALSALLGTGCSCHIRGGIARGVVE